MRRRFARGGFRPLRRILRGGIPPLLLRSNELLSSGRFSEAANGLEELARASEERGGRRAAHLYLEAGRARIMASQKAEGITLLKRGLALLAASPFRYKLAPLTQRIRNELREQGLVEEAEQIAGFARGLQTETVSLTAEPSSRSRPTLPTRCPGCGAPVRPDEVDWLDDVTAECEYCGSPVRAE